MIPPFDLVCLHFSLPQFKAVLKREGDILASRYVEAIFQRMGTCRTPIIWWWINHALLDAEPMRHIPWVGQ
jgi:hypothetical protein